MPSVSFSPNMIGGSIHLHKFLQSMELYSSKTPESTKLRREVFSTFTTRTTSKSSVSLKTLEKQFISMALKQSVSSVDESTLIFNRFRPVYQLSLQSAKARCNSTSSSSSTTKVMGDPNNLVFAEFRSFIIILCLHASMLDMLKICSETQDSVAVNATTNYNYNSREDEAKISLKAFLQNYNSLKDFDFIAFKSINSEDEAKQLFQNINVRRKNFVNFMDWSTYLKKEEIKQGTTIGTFLVGNKSPDSPSSNSSSIRNKSRPSTASLTSDGSRPERLSTRPKASSLRSFQSSPRTSQLTSSRQSTNNTTRPKSALSRKSSSTTTQSNLLPFPIQIGGCHTQKGGSSKLQNFLSVFHLYADKSPQASKARRKEFDSMKSKERSQKSFQDVENFCSKKLIDAYGASDGFHTFATFRPSFIPALRLVQFITKGSSDAREVNDIHITFEQFRIFNVCLCIYAAMLDSFTLVNGSSDGIESMDESTWLTNYNKLRGLGFIGVSATTLDNDMKVKSVFRQMDSNMDGRVDFEEYCEYIKKMEIENTTELGEMLSGSLTKNGSRNVSPRSVVAGASNKTDIINEDDQSIGGSIHINRKKKNVDYGATYSRKGVSVHWMENGFMNEVLESGLERSSIIYQIDDLNQDHTIGVIRKKGQDVCSIDGKLGVAYVDCLEGEDNVGSANIMLSYASGNAIGDIVDTLVEFCKTSKLDPKRTYVWISCLCINQHRYIDQTKSGVSMPFNEFRDVFYKRVEGIGHVLAMLSPWNEPLCLSRIWSIITIYTANQSENCKLSIVMPPREKQKMMESLNDKDGLQKLYSTLTKSKVQYAKAAHEKERESILRLVESDTPGFSVVNCDVSTILLEWIRSGVLEAIQAKEGESNELVIFGVWCAQVASVLEENGEYEEAMKLYKKTLKIQESFFGFNHPTVALSHSNIAAVLHKQCEYDEALTEYKIALELQKGYGFSVAHETATTMNNIAVVLENKGDYDQALKEYRNSIELKEEVLEDKRHLSFATTFNNIGSVLKKKGEFDDAIDAYKKALAIRKEKQGDHPETAAAHNNVGGALFMKGLYDEALEEFQTALSIRESILGPYHESTAASHNNIGMCYRKKREFEKATIEFKKAIAIDETLKGTSRPSTASNHQIIESLELSRE